MLRKVSSQVFHSERITLWGLLVGSLPLGWQCIVSYFQVKPYCFFHRDIFSWPWRVVISLKRYVDGRPLDWLPGAACAGFVVSPAFSQSALIRRSCYPYDSSQIAVPIFAGLPAGSPTCQSRFHVV